MYKKTVLTQWWLVTFQLHEDVSNVDFWSTFENLLKMWSWPSTPSLLRVKFLQLDLFGWVVESRVVKGESQTSLTLWFSPNMLN
jgi:hypothetical protein